MSRTQSPFACIPRHLLRDTRIHGSLHVLCAIASYAGNATGEAWPSLAMLADDTGLSRHGVHYHLGRLVDAGVLVAVRRGGGRHAAKYRLAWVHPQRPVTRDPESRPTELRVPSHDIESPVLEGSTGPLTSANGAEKTNELVEIGTRGTHTRADPAPLEKISTVELGELVAVAIAAGKASRDSVTPPP